MIGRFLANMIVNIGNWAKNTVFHSKVLSEIGFVENVVNISSNCELRNQNQLYVGDNAIIKSFTIVNSRSKEKEYGIHLGKESCIKEYCYIDSYGGYINIGDYVSISQNSILAGQGGIEIGDYTMIGGHTYILSSNHKFSTIEVPYSALGSSKTKTIIGKNVWIGGGSIILPGIQIGNHAVIGAGSVVDKNVAEKSIFYNSRSKYKEEKINYKNL